MSDSKNNPQDTRYMPVVVFSSSSSLEKIPIYGQTLDGNVQKRFGYLSGGRRYPVNYVRNCIQGPHWQSTQSQCRQEENGNGH